jgi:hypothetical protein
MATSLFGHPGIMRSNDPASAMQRPARTGMSPKHDADRRLVHLYHRAALSSRPPWGLGGKLTRQSTQPLRRSALPGTFIFERGYQVAVVD